MNVLIQFAIAQSGHFSFPLLAEGVMRTPEGDLPIVEFGRTKAEVYQRVFGFADLHTHSPNGKNPAAVALDESERKAVEQSAREMEVAVIRQMGRKAGVKRPFVDNKSGHWDKWTGPQEYRQ